MSILVSAMPRKPPRYDLPHAAPEPLRQVQLFVNTINLEQPGEQWLASWLEEQGVVAGPEELDRACLLREALREFLYANNGFPVEGDPWIVLTCAADSARLSIDFSSASLVPRAAGVDRALGNVLAVAYRAMADGSWGRLKACRNHGCRWAFYDLSKNRSATWCSMQLCGNRRKIRAYRERHAA
jgi:predicted RNA-binding Zn ribbon-like protein